MDRLEELRQIQKGQEERQRMIEGQLEEFVAENERIRQQII